ncbi:uncharacterized protein LOC134247708 [Saccostrea cucullata]|uniref:uncharacterized protein LOC134247708 n=1 Tax=Saccostrea cuccullata TaxID=36930 RepID=UPI002ED078A0
MGFKWTNDYVVFSERKTWLGARDVCKSMGNVLLYNRWNLMNWYIKTKATRKGWSVTDDVWLGLIKHQSSERWYAERKYNCHETTMTISGQNWLEKQCAVLNMSAAHPGDKLMLYATSCEGHTFGFVCLEAQGEIPNGVEHYPFSEVEEKSDRRLQLNTSSQTECAISSFSNIQCYVATYFPKDKYCVAERTSMIEIPETSALPPSTYLYPCPPETIAETSSVEMFIDASTTTFQNLDVTSSLAELSDDTTTVIHSISQTTTVFQTQKDTTTASVDGMKTVTETHNGETTYTDLSKGTTTKMPHCTTEVNSGCLCTRQITNIEGEKLNQKVLEIKKILTVNISSLSSTMRKKISAPDDRQSSLAIGTMGICVIIGVVMALIGGDMVNIVSCIKYLFCCKRRLSRVQHEVFCILLSFSTWTHRGWYDFHDSMQMLVESVVSCPKSEDGRLLRSSQLVIAVLLLRGSV